MIDKKCTILVNSCDNYSDLWDPFFKLFYNYWGSCPYEIVLNTESKDYSYPGLNIKTFNLYTQGEKVPWGKRIIEHLVRIETEFVIILLDDFFLREYVNQKKIDNCIRWMKSDVNIAVFSFEVVEDLNNIESVKYEGFVKRPRIADYRFNLQASLWRTKELMSFIMPHETPWEWEVFGNVRSFGVHKEFYSCSNKSNYRIINYGFNVNGMGVFRGKWVTQDVDPLFKKHGINIDYSVRGEYSTIKINRPLYKKIMRAPYHIKNWLYNYWRKYKSLGFFWSRYYK